MSNKKHAIRLNRAKDYQRKVHEFLEEYTSEPQNAAELHPCDAASVHISEAVLLVETMVDLGELSPSEKKQLINPWIEALEARRDAG